MESLKNAFYTAIKKGDLPTVTHMLESHPSLVSEPDENGLSALLTAVYYQEAKIVRLLINYGAPQNLFEACAVGNLENVISILTQDSSGLNNYSPDGFQPLGLASFFGHTEIVRLLLERGADFGSASKNGLSVTPLNSAAAGKHTEIARMLLENGADPNFRQAEGFTPLHAASQNGQREMVELLLKYGAKKELKTAQGLTSLDLALKSSHSKLSDLLQ